MITLNGGLYLIYDRTIIAATAIMVEMNEVEGYLPGETEVVLLGRLDSKGRSITSMTNIDRFKDLAGYKKVAITYPLTFERFYKLMGYPINVTHEKAVISSYKNNATVIEMPIYPAAGFCEMVDDRMVVKLS